MHLSQPVLLLLVVSGIAVLIKGADLVVDGASGLAIRAGMPKVIVGATIVSLGTTSPECAVSVMAAWSGESGLALGNAVGSIIADTGLIFGVGCLMVNLPADRFVLQRQGWVQFGTGILLAALCYNAYFLEGDEAVLSRLTGALLLTLLVVYLFVSIRWSRRHRYGEPFLTSEDVIEASASHVAIVPEAEDKAKKHTKVYLVAVMLAGLVVVVFSSRVLICSVTVLAERWGVPNVVIAATIVALGTSLPELVVGITSIAKGHGELMVGNVIGADILNVLFVIGASSIAAELPVVDHGDRIFLYLHLPVMLVILMLLRVFMAFAIKRGCFQRWNGFPLLMIYLGYVVSQFILTGSTASH